MGLVEEDLGGENMPLRRENEEGEKDSWEERRVSLLLWVIGRGAEFDMLAHLAVGKHQVSHKPVN